MNDKYTRFFLLNCYIVGKFRREIFYNNKTMYLKSTNFIKLLTVHLTEENKKLHYFTTLH